MEKKTTRTIHDLPRFEVLEVMKAEGHEHRLLGRINRPGEVDNGECYLLLGGEVLVALTGNLNFLGRDLGQAEFVTVEDSMPEVLGSKLMYLSHRHSPLHVWMVSEPGWKWTRERFQAIDAIFRRIQDDKVSIVDGEEVTEWTEIKPVSGGPLSRCYPVFPSGRKVLPPPGPDGVIKGGWDHVHCELCDDHVDAGAFGYIDLGSHWVCEQCYGRYVTNHDLSFLDD